MSIASTLDQARDFLLLPPDAPAAAVLQAAHDRQAEWQSKVDDPKASARLKDGAARKLRELAPMLPCVHVEVQLGETSNAAQDERIGRNQFVRLCDNVAQKIAALPAGEEKAMLLCRLEDIRDNANKGATTSPAPPAPPPSPPPPLTPDPAVPVFEAKLADLQAAVDREEANKRTLMRLIAEATRAMSRLRDQADRDRAESEIENLERRAEELLSRVTQPPVHWPKLVAERLDAADAALDRGELAGAPGLLAKAAELFPQLGGDALAPATTRHASLTARHGQLVSAAEAEAANRRLATEKLAAAAAAIAQPDLPRATALLAQARTAVAAIRDLAARAGAEVEITELGARLLKLEREAREQAAKQRAVETNLVALRGLLDRRETAPAKKLLDETRTAASALADRAARDAALASLNTLAARLEELLKAPPLPPSRGPQPGQLLRLTPREGVLITGFVPVPLRFVARPRFVVGRFGSGSPADVSVPLTEKRVGRGHVTFTRRGEELLIQDGDAEKPSANGSKLDEEPLATAPVPASFARERVLSLGGIFSFAAHHLPTEAPGGPLPPSAAHAEPGDGKTVAIALVTGCMKFTAKTDAHLPAQAVWLFTDASLGSSPAAAVSLSHSGLAELHARMHFWRDSFWIENLRSGNAVRVGDRVLAKGEAAPLHAGDTLHLGQLAYEVAIDP